MNIAIVDDEKIELEAAEVFLRAYIKKFWADYESRIHIDIFYRVNEFLTFFSPKIYNLVILGVHVKNIAQFIRTQGDNNVDILFLDAYGEDFV